MTLEIPLESLLGASDQVAQFDELVGSALADLTAVGVGDALAPLRLERQQPAYAGVEPHAGALG